MDPPSHQHLVTATCARIARDPADTHAHGHQEDGSHHRTAVAAMTCGASLYR